MANINVFSKIGAALGLVAFLGIAMLPAALYGGYAGVLLAGGIFGAPLAPTFWVRTFIMGGMVLGTVAVGALFTVLGAVAGSAVGTLSKLPSSSQAAEQK